MNQKTAAVYLTARQADAVLFNDRDRGQGLEQAIDADGFELMLRFVDSTHRRLLPQHGTKLSQEAMQEASHLCQLLAAVLNKELWQPLSVRSCLAGVETLRWSFS